MLELGVATRKVFSFPIENNTSFISHLLVNWKRKQTRCRLFEAEIVWGETFCTLGWKNKNVYVFGECKIEECDAVGASWCR